MDFCRFQRSAMCVSMGSLSYLHVLPSSPEAPVRLSHRGQMEGSDFRLSSLKLGANGDVTRESSGDVWHKGGPHLGG